MPPFDAAGIIDPLPTPQDTGAQSDFAFDEIGWIAAELPAIALTHGIAPCAMASGAVIADAHRDVEPLRRLAAHPRLLRRARAALGGPVAISGTQLAIDTPPPAAAEGVVVTVFLDMRPCAERPKSAVGRFGTIAVRRGDAPVPAAERGRSFSVAYVPAAARPGVFALAAVGEGDLWPAAHLAFG
ncbi:MAG: hypothetical protein AB7P02_03800 [Alphaproteobacteria bacterium]